MPSPFPFFRSSATSSVVCTPVTDDLGFGATFGGIDSNNIVNTINNNGNGNNNQNYHQRQTSASLVGSAKQRITRNNRAKFGGGRAGTTPTRVQQQQLSDWSPLPCSRKNSSEMESQNTLEHHLKKDKALALWKGNVVQNSIMSSSLDR